MDTPDKVDFDLDLIARYDRAGPRYTSYPTAAQFTEDVNETDYRRWAARSNEDLIPRPLSLYIHIPFCDTVCYYCGCNKIVTKDHSRAAPYLKDLFREIELQASLYDSDRVVEQLHLGGGTPTFLDKDQLNDLLNKIRQHFHMRYKNGGEYSIEIDPRSVDSSAIHHLRNLGFNRLSLGVQDFDKDVQKAVNRIQTLEQTQAIFIAARQAQFTSINIDLIYGLPLQTVGRFSKTLNTLIELNPDRVALYNYAHLPQRFPPQRRIDAADLPTAKEKLDILELAIKKLSQAGYVYIGMDHFAKPLDELAVAQRNNRLHRNFQGYSAHGECDLIAMGVSAISNVGDNFSQNTNKLKDYHQALSSNYLPVTRGFELEADDILRREIIHQLMCHFHLNIDDLERRWDIHFQSYFSKEVDKLREMESDGLLKSDNTSLCISARGRLLVRNICMVFDHYSPQQDNAAHYSRLV